MMRKLLLVLLVAIVATASYGQMRIDGKTLYGNEWIDYSKKYWKLTVSEDGMYKVTAAELKATGFPIDRTPLSKLQMFFFGKEYAFYRSTDGVATDSDYILFYGKQNRSELDKHIHLEGIEIFNPEYSLINDESAYFITIADQDVSEKVSLQQTDLTGVTSQPLTYYMHEEKVVFSNKYYKPVLNAEDVQYSTIMNSEGFGTFLQKETKFNVPVSNFVANGIIAKLNLRLGGNRTGHKHEIFVDNKLEKTLRETDVPSRYTRIFDESMNISPTLLTGDLDVRVNSSYTDPDKHRISVAKLTYPRSFSFAKGVKYQEVNIQRSSRPNYILLDSWGDEQQVFAYVPSQGKIYASIERDGKVALLLPPFNQETKVVLYSVTKSIIGNKSVTFKDYSTLDHDFILLSDKRLMDDGNGNNYVQEYADYKASDLGGGYDPIIIDVDDIYNQFAYGVDRHFISVRNFSHFIKPRWSSAKFLFIVGHGLEYRLYRSKANQARNEQKFHVPTFGQPGSDVLLTSNIGKASPLFATGRIAVETPDELKVYLEKVKEFDQAHKAPQTIEDKLWLKNAIHLSGGDKPTLRENIFRYLGIMEDKLKTGKIGGDVETFTKKSTQEIEQSISEQIFDKINEGVSILTFFGHSAVGSFDFNLDKVSNYKNKGKYPFLFSLGCHSGNIHTDASYSISREFVLIEDKGAISFIAASGVSYENDQFAFGRDFYELLGGDMYGKSTGEVSQVLLRKFDGDRIGFQLKSYLQQNTLHGDPSLVLFASEKPDVICDEKSAYTEPSVVDVYEKEFTFCVDIANIGYSVNEEKLEVQLEHVSPQGKVLLDTILTVDLPKYKDQLCVKLPIVSEDIKGENRMRVILNPNKKVSEGPGAEAYDNNRLRVGADDGFPFFVLSNSATPTYPREYGIVNTKNVMLKASSFNAFDEPQSFHLELDTTKLFNSPAKQSYTVTNVRGSLAKEVELMSTPEIVYYWRVSQDTTGTSTPPVWNTSSFVYVPGSVGDGWNHSHYYQYLDNELDGLNLINDRKLSFNRKFNEIKFSIRDPEIDRNNVRHFLNSLSWGVWRRNTLNGVSVIVYDPLKGDTWISKYDATGIGLYGSNVKNIQPGKHTPYFEYDESTHDSLLTFLTKIIPDGNMVLVVFQNHGKTAYPYMKWMSQTDDPNSLIRILEREGAKKVRDLHESGTMPYFIVYVKGDKNNDVIIEEHADEPGGGVSGIYQVPLRLTEGELSSKDIGPALSYTSLEWSVDYTKDAKTDTVSIDVIGIDIEGKETILYPNIVDFDINFDLSSIDASKYPRLRLRFNSKDEVNRTTPQLTKLRVYYTPLPDVALLSEKSIKKSFDSGETIAVDLLVENPSSTDMPAFDMEYSLTSQRGDVITQTEKVAALAAGEKKEVSTALTPTTKGGKYQLRVEANNAKFPSEQYYFNNLAVTELDIKGDTLSPVLDVTFDGVTILDNDIVSATPLIEISVKDENQYLLLNDTSKYVILLHDPDNRVEQIKFSDGNVQFYPASQSDNNIARLEYRPTLATDGTYKLSIEARDQSNNVAGQSTYEVNFRVFQDEMISEVFNYPNPFSTSTQFVFTLTGDEQPSNILIRIMTVTGKVVKEITSAELGNLKIGLNKTDYKWDGTDEYGDRLANGVYLYQVITKKSDGSDFKQFKDETQSKVQDYFKDGYGKMVIMR